MKITWVCKFSGLEDFNLYKKKLLTANVKNICNLKIIKFQISRMIKF